MAEQKLNKKVPSEKSKSSGIKKRWITNNIIIVMVVVVVILTTIGVLLHRSYYDSVKNNLEIRANTQAKYINTYMTSSYVEFYEYSRQAVQSFSDSDKLEMQILDEYGRVMFSSAGVTAGYLPTTTEVENAFTSGKTQTYTGYDAGIDDDVISTTAVINYHDDSVIGGVRFVSSTRVLKAQLGQLYIVLAAAGLGIMLLILLTNTVFIRSIVNPILNINNLAKKIANGQLGARLDTEYDDEIGELCETINEMSQDLAASDKMKNEFISSVSHELRTPLTAISGWTDTIAESLDDPETAKLGLGIIRNETARLSQMVEELLDFSRLESGRMKLQMDYFDIRGEVYDAVFTYTELLRKKNLIINYDEDEELIRVHGDKNRLKQVFLNILDNAAKYGADGESVDILVTKKGEHCIVTITDHGQGIPADELPRVKEKFFKGSARGRGAGIGLAVCNEILALHGGEMDITSEVSKGTTVTVRLPYVKE